MSSTSIVAECKHNANALITCTRFLMAENDFFRILISQFTNRAMRLG
jgi:hypothetical protein